MRDPLWAPWRAAFVEAKKPAVEGCIFCVFPAEQGEEADRKNLIVHRAGRAFVILNRYPYNNGHLMVVPRVHVGDLDALTPEDFQATQLLLKDAIAAARKAYSPDGFNVGMNLGRAAGAGIADHLHWHVVPRWAGDTNFMPVLAGNKVMIESLDASWARLRAAFVSSG